MITILCIYVVANYILMLADFMVAEDLPRDEDGFVTDCKSFYLSNDIIDKIDDLLYEVKDLLD